MTFLFRLQPQRQQLRQCSTHCSTSRQELCSRVHSCRRSQHQRKESRFQSCRESRSLRAVLRPLRSLKHSSVSDRVHATPALLVVVCVCSVKHLQVRPREFPCVSLCCACIMSPLCLRFAPLDAFRPASIDNTKEQTLTVSSGKKAYLDVSSTRTGVRGGSFFVCLLLTRERAAIYYLLVVYFLCVRHPVWLETSVLCRRVRQQGHCERIAHLRRQEAVLHHRAVLWTVQLHARIGRNRCHSIARACSDKLGASSPCFCCA